MKSHPLRVDAAPSAGLWPIAKVRPSPENDDIYKPIVAGDPEIRRLAVSIVENGLLEPIVVTEDGWIVSGHRRRAACELAKLGQVPVRVLEGVRRDRNRDEFVRLLREHNRQRDKSAAERMREELVDIDPVQCHARLVEHREQNSTVNVAPIEIEGQQHRCRISDAKLPFLNAIKAIIEDRRDYWPLSSRSIHYALLNDPPLKHASKPDSVYRNDKQSDKSLSDLLTRARLAGMVPMMAIDDETRPIEVNAGFDNVREFIRQGLDGFLWGYHRDLMQSQPNHIEIVVEKNTVRGVCQRVAEKFNIPITSGRGFCSIPPRHAMRNRYRASGKAKLVVLILSDFDPEGIEIAHSFARSMRDDFGIDDVHAIRVGVTPDQVAELDDPPEPLEAKRSSSRYAKFVARYGINAFELEAIPPKVLEDILADAIHEVIDRGLYEAEIQAEQEDAATIEAMSRVFGERVEELMLDIDDD